MLPELPARLEATEDEIGYLRNVREVARPAASPAPPPVHPFLARDAEPARAPGNYTAPLPAPQGASLARATAPSATAVGVTNTIPAPVPKMDAKAVEPPAASLELLGSASAGSATEAAPLLF